MDLSAPLQNAGGPQLTASPDGTATAIWTRSNGTNFIIQAATRPPGGVFGAPVDISYPLEDASNPQLAASPDGTVTAAWRHSNGAIFVIQAATRPPGGAFGAPVDLSAPLQRSLQPQLTASPDGTVTAIWGGYNGTDYIIQSASTAQPSFLLEVARAGKGSGKVTSTPAGIDCGIDCPESYLSFTKVTLTATPDPGSTFEGWGGACSDATGDTCEITMLEDLDAVATFRVVPKAKISKVKVSGPSKVKKGKKATYKVKITNSGNAAATGVRLKVSGRGLSFNTSVGKIGREEDQDGQGQAQAEEARQGQGHLQGDFEERRRQDREEEDHGQEVGAPARWGPADHAVLGLRQPSAPVLGRPPEKRSGPALCSFRGTGRSASVRAAVPIVPSSPVWLGDPYLNEIAGGQSCSGLV